MSALKHFNTGSIRQGFIIDEVSVYYRVMGLCSLKKAFLFRPSDFMQILQHFISDKDVVPFNFEDFTIFCSRVMGLCSVKNCIFHILYNNLRYHVLRYVIAVYYFLSVNTFITAVF